MTNDREGPKLVTPEPFNTCDDCSRLAIRGIQYYCADASAPRQQLYGVGFVFVEAIHLAHTATPDWCPYLNKKEEG